MRPLIQILCAIVMIGVSGAGFWFGITGILDGAVEFPTKHDHFKVPRSVMPGTYWACVAFWVGVGFGALWVGLKNLKEDLRA